MATSYPASLGHLASSLESFYPSRHRGTAASLPALLPAAASLLPEMDEEVEEEEDLPQRSRLRRRDHRSLTPTRRTRPPSTRTSSGDDESFTFRSERNLANPRKLNEKTEVELVAADGDGDGDEDDDGTRNRLSEVKEENEDEEQYRRHSKNDELLFRSGRRRSI